MKNLKLGKDYIGVGAGVMILDEKKEKILLMKRGEESKNEIGYWSKPGGSIEFGETVIESMKREMKEELNIEVKIWGYLPHTDHIIKSENEHWVSPNLIGTISKGEPKIMEPHKCSEIKWFSLKDLPEKVTQTTKEPVVDYLAGRFIKL